MYLIPPSNQAPKVSYVSLTAHLSVYRYVSMSVVMHNKCKDNDVSVLYSW